MHRNHVNAAIKRHGQTFCIETENNKLIPFSGYLTNRNTLQATDRQLRIGDLLHPVGEPQHQFLIIETTEKGLYEEYNVVKVNQHALLSRYSMDQPRDSFGRPATVDPSVIYDLIPLYLEPATTSKQDKSADRAATATGYHFTTSSRYAIQKGDKVTIGKTALTVTILLLALDGLMEFTAVATA